LGGLNLEEHTNTYWKKYIYYSTLTYRFHFLEFKSKHATFIDVPP